MAAVASRLRLAPPCPDCRGGQEVNGVPCRACAAPSRPERRRAAGRVLYRWAGNAAGPAGRLVASVPGLGGAAGVSWGLAMIVHGVVRVVPEFGVGLLAAGVFGLMMDRRA